MTNNYYVYSAVSNWTRVSFYLPANNWAIVNVPADWWPQAISDDLIYIISQSNLYKYTATNNSYEEIYSLPQSSSYFIKNY